MLFINVTFKHNEADMLKANGGKNVSVKYQSKQNKTNNNKKPEQEE